MSFTQAETIPTTPEFSPQYTLSPEETSLLTKQLLHDRPAETNGRYACYYLDGTENFSNLGRQIERQVFEETFGNNDETMHAQYGPYEAASHFFVVVDREDAKPVGALRIIKNSPAGLKSLNDIANENLFVSNDQFQAYHRVDDLDTTWDIGTVAVPKEFRSIDHQLVSNTLYRGMHVRALYEGVEDYVSIIDKRARKIFDLLGIPFQPIVGSDPFEYLGSKDSSAMYGDAADFVAGVDRKYKEMKKSEPMKSLVFRRYAGRLALGKDIDKNLVFDH